MTKRANATQLQEFYALMAMLRERLGGSRCLSDIKKSDLPRAGVYYFFEPNEFRATSIGELRVVRVGTHGVKVVSKSTLYKRLRQHRGRRNGGGDHRISIFRGHVGRALIRRENLAMPSWILRACDRASKSQEESVERLVSEHLGRMPFLWISAETPEDRRFIESNSIGFLAGSDRTSANWLGQFAERSVIEQSGLWNINHTSEGFAPDFLERLEVSILRTTA